MIVVGVDDERAQHLVHPILHLEAQLIEFAVLDEVRDVVVGPKILPGFGEPVPDAVGRLHRGDRILVSQGGSECSLEHEYSPLAGARRQP